jgi:nucleotide-binding universal stress UspA family protein
MRTLLAVDRSPASEAVVQAIASRPWPEGSLFEVVSVVEPMHLWPMSEVTQEAAVQAGQVAERAVASLRSAGFRATSEVLWGEPKSTLLDRIRSNVPDLVVVGSHDTSVVTRFILGSVAATVLRHAPCSVEIVRAKPRRAAHFRVLVATDGSDYSNRAACFVAERPWPGDTEVRVLSAVELILPPARAMLEPPFTDPGVNEAARADAMKKSQDAIARAREILSRTGLDISESISVLTDKPKSIILHEAAQWSADLIVLGSHGRLGLDHLLLGSVSEAVAMHAECSVEVIRKS